jgi:hypothetical protein
VYLVIMIDGIATQSCTSQHLPILNSLAAAASWLQACNALLNLRSAALHVNTQQRVPELASDDW